MRRFLIILLILWSSLAFGATYYLDLDGGNDGAAGTAIGTAWLTLSKAATTMVAGDVCYVRANTSETPGALVSFTNDGTASAPIRIIGCDSVVNNPWSDGSDILPLIDFNESSYYLNVNKACLFITRCHFKNSHNTTEGNARVLVNGCKFEGCKFEDAAGFGLKITSSSHVLVKDCIFLNNGTTSTSYGSVIINSGLLYAKNCTFDPYSTDRSIINPSSLGTVIMEGCTLSGAGQGITGNVGPNILRNTSFSSVTTPITISRYLAEDGALTLVFSDGFDFDGGVIEKGHQWVFGYGGEVDIDESWARTGGATKGIRVQINTSCGLYAPLHFMSFWIYQDDADSHDYRFYYKFPDSNFGGDLNQTQFYFVITELKSNGTIAKSTMPAHTYDYDSTAWAYVDVTYDADTAGELRVDGYIAKSDADGIVYVDPYAYIDGAGTAAPGYADGNILGNLRAAAGGGGAVRRVGGVLAE